MSVKVQHSKICSVYKQSNQCFELFYIPGTLDKCNTDFKPSGSFPMVRVCSSSPALNFNFSCCFIKNHPGGVTGVHLY